MIYQTSHFKRSLKKLARGKPEMIPVLFELLVLFMFKPNDPALGLHKLTGILSGTWAIKIAYDLRLLFKYDDNGDILLLNIGTHDEVY